MHQKRVQQRLRELHPGYRHEKPPSLPLGDHDDEVLDAAHRRAEALLEAAEQESTPHRNPTTTFHQLVARIRGA